MFKLSIIFKYLLLSAKYSIKQLSRSINRPPNSKKAPPKKAVHHKEGLQNYCLAPGERENKKLRVRKVRHMELFAYLPPFPAAVFSAVRRTRGRPAGVWGCPPTTGVEAGVSAGFSCGRNLLKQQIYTCLHCPPVE